jgi:hypothetical protein
LSNKLQDYNKWTICKNFKKSFCDKELVRELTDRTTQRHCQQMLKISKNLFKTYYKLKSTRCSLLTHSICVGSLAKKTSKEKYFWFLAQQIGRLISTKWTKLSSYIQISIVIFKIFQANLVVFTAITSEIYFIFLPHIIISILSFLRIQIQISVGVILIAIGMLIEACVYTYIIRVPSNTKTNQVTTAREVGAGTQPAR